MLTLSNLLTCIRNALSSRLNQIDFIIPGNAGILPENRLAILTILRKNGTIRGFTYKEFAIKGKPKAKLIVYLKYDGSGKSVIDSLFLISKPSRRVYISSTAL